MTDTNELVERLRSPKIGYPADLAVVLDDLCQDAADTIDRLTKENERLREALDKIIEGAPKSEPPPHCDILGYFSDDYSDLYDRGVETQHWHDAEIARAAQEDKP